MNDITLMNIKDIKIKEIVYESFRVYEIITKDIKDNEFRITLFNHNGISWFKELDEIIVDLEANPDSLQDSIERLKALVPLEV